MPEVPIKFSIPESAPKVHFSKESTDYITKVPKEVPINLNTSKNVTTEVDVHTELHKNICVESMLWEYKKSKGIYYEAFTN